MSDNQDQDQDLSPFQKRIKELENQYKELSNNVASSTNKVVEDERALLKCLQQLMPLQNAYLGSIINALQKQIETLSIPTPVPSALAVSDAAVSATAVGDPAVSATATKANCEGHSKSNTPPSIEE